MTRRQDRKVMSNFFAVNFRTNVTMHPYSEEFKPGRLLGRNHTVCGAEPGMYGRLR